MPRIQNIHQPAELKNYAINGALDFWQEKVGTTTTVNTATGTSGYSADMFAYQSGGGATTHNYSLVRSTDVPTFSQSGFQSQYSILFTNITGTPSFAAGDWREPFLYKMEGLDYAKLHGKVVTFGFWVKASVTGTYSFAMKNASFNRSYVTTFSINNANTWEFKAITVQLDSSGTWGFDTSIGIQIHIGSITGTTFQTSTLNQWQSGNFVMASTATNYQSTSNATVRLAQFSIVEGSLGVGPLGFQRAGKTIQQELALCQRYYEKSYLPEEALGAITLNGAHWWNGQGVANRPFTEVHFRTSKRTTPSTVTVYNPNSGATSSIRDSDSAVDFAANVGRQGHAGFAVNPTGTPVTTGVLGVHWIADARL